VLKKRKVFSGIKKIKIYIYIYVEGVFVCGLFYVLKKRKVFSGIKKIKTLF